MKITYFAAGGRPLMVMAMAIGMLILLTLSSASDASNDVKARNKDFEYSASWLFKNLVNGGSDASDYAGPPPPLLFIGAGLPRTGTASFQKAMSMLGFNCYHFYKVVQTKGHMQAWYDYLVKGSRPFDQVVAELANSGYNATVDTPVALQYENFVKHYPDAKVVLTQRSEANGGEKWAKSMVNTNLRYQTVTLSIPWRWIPQLTRAADFLRAQHDYVGLPRRNHTLLPAFYSSWNEQVIKNVPEDNLLVFSAKDGWEPLCEFLSPLSDTVKTNCDIIIAANVPYPRVNESGLIENVIATCETITLLFQSVPAILLVISSIVMMRSRTKMAPGKSKTL
jgi:Sulfotransferase domain